MPTIGVIAKVLGAASALGGTAGAITLSAAETIVALIEEGFLGLPAPSTFRQDISLLKEVHIDRVLMSARLSQVDVEKRRAEIGIDEAKARKLVADAVNAENRNTIAAISGDESRKLDEALDAVAELREALLSVTAKGGRLTIDSPEIRKIRRKRAKRPAQQRASASRRRAVE